MKNWRWATIFQHNKKGGSGKLMPFIRGGSWLNYSCLIMVLTTMNGSEIALLHLYVSK